MKKFLVSILILSLCSLVTAAPVPKNTEYNYIRLLKIANTDVALQTSVIRYTKDNKNIDLISVVHIGDKQYYENLNNLFTNYDALCYELVAEKGVKIKTKNKKENPVNFMQKIMKDVLKLDHQLDIIDYNKKNFVHADMSPEEMVDKLKQRGDTKLTVTLKVIAELIQNQNLKNQHKDSQEFDLLEAIMNPNYVKRIMANQLANGGENDLGQTLHQILVKDRNEAAMNVVLDELKTKNKIGLFYGAAHMPDFHKRLINLGYKPTKLDWITAWDMKPTREELQFKLMKKLFE